MELDLQVIRQQVVHATKALLEQANLKAGDIFVLSVKLVSLKKILEKRA